MSSFTCQECGTLIIDSDADKSYITGCDHWPIETKNTNNPLRCAVLDEFNPDWDLLEATQVALCENMELLKRYKQALHDAIRRPKGVIPKSADGLHVDFDEY